MLFPRGGALAFLFTAALPLLAQDSAALRNRLDAHTVLLGSPDEDRLRIDELLGRRTLAGGLIRSPSAASLDSVPNPKAGVSWSFVGPVLDGTWNSQIPYSLNDGALWAGRGLSNRLTAGVRANVGRIQLLIAPELMHVQNRAFALLPSDLPSRSSYASPFHGGPLSADVPIRFGSQPFTVASPGQSAMWVPAGPVDVGIATENQWWGPAIQNALVMSNNAAGIPHAFLRTSHPLHTRAGDFEAKGIAGEITESLYFDDDPGNDHRSLSGVVATFAPAVEPHLTIGATRVVYSPAPRFESVSKHALDALTRWSTSRPDSTHRGSDTFDQLFSLFGRWVFPESGLEFYAEWAHMLPPSSLRDLLIEPQRTQGYTLGMQLAGEVRPNALLRFQAEVTDLEQTAASRAADTLSFYTSRNVPQGYTQRGKVIGAAIGPGASSQLLALDYMPTRWDVGVFVERIRWDNDVYYLQPTGFSWFSHDVTVLAGLRGTTHVFGSELHAEYSVSRRLNFLFQNLRGGYGPQTQNDFYNHTLRVWFAPWASRRAKLSS